MTLFATLEASWLASFWLVLMPTLLNQAALSGNGTVVAGMRLLALLMIGWQLKGAVRAFMDAADTALRVVGASPRRRWDRWAGWWAGWLGWRRAGWGWSRRRSSTLRRVGAARTARRRGAGAADARSPLAGHVQYQRWRRPALQRRLAAPGRDDPGGRGAASRWWPGNVQVASSANTS